MQPNQSALDTCIARLHEIGAVKVDLEEGFVLHRNRVDPGASTSPIYFNLRTRDNPKSGPIGARELRMMTALMLEILDSNHVSFHGIIGTAWAGVPFAHALAGLIEERMGMRLPVFEYDKHTGEITSTFDLPLYHKLLLVDDVVSDGQSKRPPINIFRSQGYKVEDCVVFVDREQGGTQTLKSFGVRLHAATTRSKFVESLYRQSKLSPREAAEIERRFAPAV